MQKIMIMRPEASYGEVEFRGFEAEDIVDCFFDYFKGMLYVDEQGVIYFYNSSTKKHEPQKGITNPIREFIGGVLAPALKEQEKQLFIVKANLDTSTDEGKQEMEKLSATHKYLNKMKPKVGIEVGGHRSYVGELESILLSHMNRCTNTKRLLPSEALNFGGELWDYNGKRIGTVIDCGKIVTHGTYHKKGDANKAKVFQARIRKMYPNEEDYKYFFLLLGRMLNPNTKSFCVFEGTGGLGKSSIMTEFVTDTMRPYIGGAGAEAIRSSKPELSAGLTSGLYRAALTQNCILLEESDDTEVMNIARIKEYTGGTIISVKKMHQDPVDVFFQTNIILMTNTLPDRMSMDDEAFLRRFCYFPLATAFDGVLEVDGKTYSTKSEVKSAIQEEASHALAYIYEQGIVAYSENPNYKPAYIEKRESDLKKDTAVAGASNLLEYTEFFAVADTKMHLNVSQSIKSSTLAQAYRKANMMRGSMAHKGKQMKRYLQNAGFVYNGKQNDNARQYGKVCNIGFRLEAMPAYNTPDLIVMITQDTIDKYGRQFTSNYDMKWSESDIRDFLKGELYELATKGLVYAADTGEKWEPKPIRQGYIREAII